MKLDFVTNVLVRFGITVTDFIVSFEENHEVSNVISHTVDCPHAHVRAPTHGHLHFVLRMICACRKLMVCLRSVEAINSLIHMAQECIHSQCSDR